MDPDIRKSLNKRIDLKSMEFNLKNIFIPSFIR